MSTFLTEVDGMDTTSKQREERWRMRQLQEREEELLKEEMAQRAVFQQKEEELRRREFDAVRASQRETIYKLIALQEAETAVGDADDALTGDTLTVDAIRHSANVSKRKRRAMERHRLPPAKITLPAFVADAERAAQVSIAALEEADGELTAARDAFQRARLLDASVRTKDDEIVVARKKLAHSARSLDNALDVCAMLKEEIQLRNALAAKLASAASARSSPPPAAAPTALATPGPAPATPTGDSDPDFLRAFALNSPPSPYGAAAHPAPTDAAGDASPRAAAPAARTPKAGEANALTLAAGPRVRSSSRSASRTRTRNTAHKRRSEKTPGLKRRRRAQSAGPGGSPLLYTPVERELVEARKSENRALVAVEAVARDTVRLNKLFAREKAQTKKAKAARDKLGAQVAKMRARADELDAENADMERKQELLERELSTLATKLDAKMRHELAELEKKLAFERTQEVSRIRRQGAEHAQAARTAPDALGALRGKVHDALELLATLKDTRHRLQDQVHQLKIQRREHT